MATAKPSQVSLPPVPLPQFGDKEFSEHGVGLFNTTIASIAKQINALSPVNPNVRIRAQFLAQFRAADFEDENLGFINQQMTEMVKNVNKLYPAGDTKVPPVQLVQLRKDDFKQPGIPVASQFITAIITRLNAVQRGAVKPQF